MFSSNRKEAGSQNSKPQKNAWKIIRRCLGKLKGSYGALTAYQFSSNPTRPKQTDLEMGRSVGGWFHNHCCRRSCGHQHFCGHWIKGLFGRWGPWSKSATEFS